MVTEDRPFKNGGIVPTPDGSRLSAVFGYIPGEFIKKRNGETWQVQERDGELWAVRTPEHDTKAEP